MANDDRALERVKRELDKRDEELSDLRKKLKDQRSKLPAVGLERKAHAAAGGVLLGIAEEGKIGQIMGHDITVAHFLPVLDYSIDKFTDGKPPGGLAGDIVQSIRQAGDAQTVLTVKDLTRMGVTMARAYLGMNRPSGDAQKTEAAHPAPEATVINQDGSPVT